MLLILQQNYSYPDPGDNSLLHNFEHEFNWLGAHRSLNQDLRLPHLIYVCLCKRVHMRKLMWRISVLNGIPGEKRRIWSVKLCVPSFRVF